MSEDSIHRTTLVPRAASQLAQVLTAGRQLGIAAQLKDDIDRDRLIALLKRIPSERAIWWLSSSQPLSTDMIVRFEKWWNWDELSKNKELPWSLELIERFEDRWDWRNLARNESLPWSLELIERFADRWNWWSLSWVESLPWSFELIECFDNASHDKNDIPEHVFAMFKDLPTLRPEDIVAIMEFNEARAAPSQDIGSFQDLEF